MAPVAIAMVLCAWLGMNDAEVPLAPEIVPSMAFGILTSTTMMLKQPLCYFDNVVGLPCSPNQCEVWLVVARGNGVQKFESEKTSGDILSRSPYPDAFLDDMSPNFFITKVGVQNSFLCADLPGLRYFRVGAEGRCYSTNCNGVLPTGTTVRVKYILVDPSTETIESDSRWSQPITLLTPKSSSSIVESSWKRSGSMVVITVLLSCCMAVLVVLLAALLLLDWSDFPGGQADNPEQPHLNHVQGIRRYNTHNLNNSEYYSNVRI
ncbi:hypothetical protein AGOR_G00030140 [Albula goreensis]|uniref:Uncharacterized protein n=1 Tax=Albula goreensis TaxID=1534307 RepID=A0A8T3E2X7_9TELE|nr:hypothetical protein AGOR_G00030140 [Albula goreensis]